MAARMPEQMGMLTLACLLAFAGEGCFCRLEKWPPLPSLPDSLDHSLLPPALPSPSLGRAVPLFLPSFEAGSGEPAVVL